MLVTPHPAMLTMAKKLLDENSLLFLALRFAYLASEKYSQDERSFVAALDRDKFFSLAVHEIHHTKEKIHYFENIGSMPENASNLIKYDQVAREYAAQLSEIAVVPAPYSVLYRCFRAAAIVQDGKSIQLNANLNSAKATMMLVAALQRSPRFMEIYTGSEEALRQVATSMLEDLYTAAFGKKVEYAAVFSTKETLQKLERLEEA